MFEILSDPCVNLSFEAGAGRLVGLATRLWRRELVGSGVVRAVKFRAGALCAVVPNLSVHTLTDRVIAWREVFSNAPKDFEAQVLAASDDAEAARILDTWLSTRVTQPVHPDVSLVVKVIERVTADPMILSVQQMSVIAGVDVRSLQELFRMHVGASPKWLMRRVRLQEAAGRIERGELANLASLAAELGYTDHAHLTRDFKAAVGCTPSALARDVWR
jgi:AraC-like DNA-binding protein